MKLGYDNGVHPKGCAFDEEVQQGVKDMKQWQDAYDLIERLTGTAPTVDETYTPSIAEMYREALSRMNVDVPPDTDDAAIPYLFQQHFNSRRTYGTETPRPIGAPKQMAGDAALNNDGWRKRFPNARLAKRI